MLYFAYGSNMSSRRLGQRVPQAVCIGSAVLSDHALRFHKSGRDGSGKGDAFFTGCSGDIVHGVLFELDGAGKKSLDRIEGVGAGYAEKRVQVDLAGGDEVDALTYVATHIDTTLLPFTWYKAHVLHGARAAALPAMYLDLIASVPALCDIDRERHASEMSIHTSLAR
jgi:gamma-glutamylcyclotransferase (GGCT)/AIG2-like uncharacterized protein YtfP